MDNDGSQYNTHAYFEEETNFPVFKNPIILLADGNNVEIFPVGPVIII